MSKALIAFGLTTIVLILALGSTNEAQSMLRGSLTEPDTVPYVDLHKYAKTWYEQSLIPFYFERDSSHNNATYSLNDDGTIKIVNEGLRHGKFVRSVGKGFSQDDTNSKLKIQFVSTLDIKGDYWIVRLGKNYEYTVISNPNESLLWIMSEEK
jgi:apolipoprotein D and lipocalin family protein